MSLNFFTASALINAFICGLLGFLVILKNRKELINRLFFGMSISVVFWSFGYWQWMFSGDAHSALFWVKFLSVASIFIPIFYFHWVLTYLNLHRKKKKLLKILYIIAFIFVLFSFSKLFIEKVEPISIFPFWPVPGILYNVYLVLIYFGLSIYALFILWRQYGIVFEPQKSTIKYIIIASIVGFLGGATNFFLWYKIPINPYGNILVSLYPLALAVAILKYHLFNIKIIATELLTFVIWIFVLIRMLLAENWQDRLINGGLLVFMIVAGILLIKSVLKEVKTREEMEELASKLKRANEKLLKLDEEKSDFISIASHQLRAPLTAVKGYASMLLEGTFGKIPAKGCEAIKTIFESSQRLVLVISDFLDIDRIEAGKMKYDVSDFDLKEMVESIVEEFKAIVGKIRGGKKGERLIVSFQCDKDKSFSIAADYNKMRQVVTNLIDNAAKYTPKGFIKVFLSQKSAGPGGAKFLIKIQDSGAGIAPETLPKLFQKFVRANRLSSPHAAGSGLGLYIVKKLVEIHGGRIWAESEGEGKGSAFYVELPAETILREKKQP